MLPHKVVDEILSRFPDRVLVSLPALGNEELRIDVAYLRAQVRLTSELPVFIVTVRDTGKLVTWGEAASPTDALVGALETITILLSSRAQAA
jgi:hypothetical protein